MKSPDLLHRIRVQDMRMMPFFIRLPIYMMRAAVTTVRGADAD